MRIECPECSLTGNIDEAAIPATGTALNCPRCKARFVVERPQGGEGVAMLDSCPSCQYATFSEEKFSVCPKCGLVVADYIHRRVVGASSRKAEAPADTPPMTPEERRRDEESRRKYGMEAPEVEVPITLLGASGAPFSLRVTGWLSIAVAFVLAVFGVSRYMEYLAKVKEAEAILLSGEQALTGFSLFWRFGLTPLLMIVYGAVIVFVANRFLCLQARAIGWLETCGWAGMAIGALTELVDLAAWWARASESASIGYYATGFFGGGLMALLWMAPPYVLVEYLRSEQFDRLKGHFT